MKDNLKNTIVKRFRFILKGVSDLLKMSIAGIGLLMTFLVCPVLSFLILYFNMPGFGFIAYGGCLLIFTGLFFLTAVIANSFRIAFYRVIKDWGVKISEEINAIPTVKETMMFLSFFLLSIIAGALLMILEILIKSR